MLHFFFLMIRRPPRSTLFPSTTLLRSSPHPPSLVAHAWGDSNLAPFDGYTEMSVGAPTDVFSGHMLARSGLPSPSTSLPTQFAFESYAPHVSTQCVSVNLVPVD